MCYIQQSRQNVKMAVNVGLKKNPCTQLDSGFQKARTNKQNNSYGIVPTLAQQDQQVCSRTAYFFDIAPSLAVH